MSTKQKQSCILKNFLFIKTHLLFAIKLKKFFTFILLLIIIPNNLFAVLDVSWWSSLAQISTSNLLASSTKIKSKCVELKGLSPGQSKICELFKDHMPSVGAGAKKAINECEYQFRNNRWNCSNRLETGIYGPIHKLGTKEAAFTYAILSAGVAYEIGRYCKLGFLKSCGCSEAPKSANVDKNWAWGGCGDNVNYGYRFSKDFIDVREKEENFKRADNTGRKLMNRWNNEVGRKLLKRQTHPKCKCHGVSGSCNMKTCWMQLPSIRQVGNILYHKYNTARKVKINSKGNMQFEDEENQIKKLKNSNNKTMQKFIIKKRNIKKKKSFIDLVYLEESPDYCNFNPYHGTIGTIGRVCNKDESTLNSCDSICCGRGYNSYTKKTLTKCNCKFQWCCQVVCETCNNITHIQTCK